MYTPNFLRQMLLSVSQKLGANTPRLALMALVEIHSSRFVALLRMTHVRWCTVPRETPKRAICCTFSLVRLHKRAPGIFVTLSVTLRSLRSALHWCGCVRVSSRARPQMAAKEPQAVLYEERSSVLLRVGSPRTQQSVRGGVFAPNSSKQEVTSRLTKLGSNIPRLALLALVEIHSSRFVALLRMTLVRCVGVAGNAL